MLARVINRSLVRSIRPLIAIPPRPANPASPAKSLLLALPNLQQSRSFAIKKRRPYQGGDPGAYSEPGDPIIIGADQNTSPLLQAEFENSLLSSPGTPPTPSTPLSGTTPGRHPPSDLVARKATLATGGGGGGGGGGSGSGGKSGGGKGGDGGSGSGGKSGGGKGGDGLPKSAYVSSTDRKRERIARLLFATFIAACIGGGIYLGRDLSEFEQTIYDTTTVPNGWSFSSMYARIKARVQNVLDFYNEPPFEKLLPDPYPDYARPYTLVIALEDLCVHSTWDREHGWRIAKRPGLDYFLAYLFQSYEIVVFTNQHDQIAAPIIQKMDPYPGYIMFPLFRSHTRYKDGKYIKDLNYLNRDLSKVIMLETNPDAWSMNPDNTIKMAPWHGDPNDKELVSLIPFLEYIPAMGIADVRPVIAEFGDKHIPTEFARREAVARAELKKRLEVERAQRKGTLGEVLLMALGLGTTKKRREDEEKTFMDLARERGMQAYEQAQKHIAEHKDEMMEEQKAMEKEAAEQMKTSLSKIFTEGLPKPPGQM